MTATLIFDDECSFCRRWITRWQARTEDRVRYVPLQAPGVLATLGIPLTDALRSVQLIDDDGHRYQGADAVLRALGRAPGRHPVVYVLRLPIVRWIAERVYRFIARHRGFASRVERRVSRR